MRLASKIIMSPLAPPLCSWVNTADCLKFRNEYRGYRLGGSSGTHGELPVQHNPSPLESLEYHDLSIATEWRLAYRRFRLGLSEGARGPLESLAANLTGSQLRSLPVVQLLELQRRERTKSLVVPDHGFHVHFGGGRLGLGLVLPSLEAGDIPYVIVQSRSGPFSQVSSAILTVKVNGMYVAKLRVFDDESDLSEIIECLHGRKSIIFFTKRGVNSPHKLELILGAYSMSCSIGPGISELTRTLQPLKTMQARYLLACENDHTSVQTMKESLTSLTVIPCMVDRICSDISASRGGCIEVTAEPYLGDIVLMDNISDPLLCMGGGNVIVPQTSSQQKYFAERKFLLVNGTHTVFAFLTLLRKYESGIHFKPPGDFTLLNWHTCSQVEKSSVWALTIARLLLLVWEYDTAVLLDAHNVDNDEDLCHLLLHYAKHTLLRFSSITDTTKRVLGGGVDNRFNGRLKNVQEFLDIANPASTGIGRRLLTLSGVGYCTLAAEVHKLVTAAHKLTSEGHDTRSQMLKIPSLSEENPPQRHPQLSPTERRIH